MAAAPSSSETKEAKATGATPSSTSSSTTPTDSGAGDAEYALGLACEKGKGASGVEDWPAVFAHYTRAVELGSAPAMVRAGYIHMYGMGATLCDPPVAIALWQRAAPAGARAVGAQWLLGLHYFSGLNCERSLSKAQMYLMQGMAFCDICQLFFAWKQNKEDALRKLMGVVIAKSMAGDAFYQCALTWVLQRNQTPEELKMSADWAIILGKRGHAHSQFQVGWCHSSDDHGLERDNVASVRWYKLAVAQHDPQACVNLALLYEGGEGGLIMSIDEALRLFLIAAPYEPIAQFNVAWLYAGRSTAEGGGALRDDVKALHYFILAANNGHDRSMLEMARNTRAGTMGVTCNWGAALEWLRKAAHAGLAMAQHELAEFYERGGKRWAAESGGTMTPSTTGEPASWPGMDEPPSMSRAVTWWRRAADSGSAASSRQIPRTAEEGGNTGGTDSKALLDVPDPISVRRKLGDESAQIRLARAYMEGTGVEIDVDQAIIWYRACIQQHRNGEAMYRLGMHYLRGSPPSLMEAIEWFVRAVDSGYPLAATPLAEARALQTPTVPAPAPAAAPAAGGGAGAGAGGAAAANQ